MYKTHGQKTGTNYQPQVLLDLSHQLSTVVLVVLATFATIPDWVGTNALFAGDSIKLADSNFCSKSHVQSTFWDLPRLATYQDKQKKNRIAKIPMKSDPNPIFLAKNLLLSCAFWKSPSSLWVVENSGHTKSTAQKPCVIAVEAWMMLSVLLSPCPAWWISMQAGRDRCSLINGNLPLLKKLGSCWKMCVPVDGWNPAPVDR